MIELLQMPEWHAEAACRGEDSDLFFPERGASTRRSKQMCAGCPVRPDCLDWAMEHNPRFGIWGGMSERERRVERRRRGLSGVPPVVAGDSGDWAAPVPPDPTSRVCSKCGVEKPIGEFHANASNSAGRGYRCRDCQSASVRMAGVA